MPRTGWLEEVLNKASERVQHWPDWKKSQEMHGKSTVQEKVQTKSSGENSRKNVKRNVTD